MKKKYIIPIICFIFVMSCASSKSGNLRYYVHEVIDRRTKSLLSVGLKVRVRVSGAQIKESKAINFSLLKAVDEYGTELRSKASRKAVFMWNNFNFKSDKIIIDLELDSPTYRMQYIKELSGILELYIPKGDSDSVIMITNFNQYLFVKSSKLKKLDLKLTIMTKRKYNILRKMKAVEEGDEDKKILDKAIDFLFGYNLPMTKNSIIFKIKGPKSKIAFVEFFDPEGEKIKAPDTESEGEILVFNFREKLPKNSDIWIYLATDKSTVKHPIKFRNIPLQ